MGGSGIIPYLREVRTRLKQNKLIVGHLGV